LQQAWDDLADKPQPAFQAVGLLSNHPDQAVPFLRTHLKPAPSVEVKLLKRLITDLDSETYAIREQASKELERLGDGAAAALEKALAKGPSLEARRRMETALKRLGGVAPSETLRALRAVEVLEHAQTPDARELLVALAGGAEGARLTREAQAALDRLARLAANKE
jgi:hypothetical protein